ncbi:Lysine 2,3-aminomutase [hydrothermal vent metagenome]|uniref:L-lysine 2,3-aminomutase n=1 Tax=hydrothermal vent metagenome TaxID=652676 RepID=A0A3B0Y2B6_9ZZZZ
MRIIPGTRCQQQTPLWQTLLSQAITTPEELLQLLELPLDSLPACLAAGQKFHLRVPRGFAARMTRGDPEDPLLRQVLPVAEELEAVPGFSHDPLDELNAMPVPGVLHKYQGRLLLTATGACAVHCRYCFRRHYPYSEANPGRTPEQTFGYLRQHPEINEVILSGGDPLTLTDTKLSEWVDQLEMLPQITRLRIHSRVPVVLPERIDDNLLDWVKNTRLRLVLVIHANHANEIAADVSTALEKLKQVGITLLNQSVLLKGVNDSVSALAGLSEALLSASVLPYYLHQLDSVQGAAHFQVSDKKAIILLNQLRTRLPGYLVPELVRENPGQASKTPL